MAVVGHPCTALCLFLLFPPSPHYQSLNHQLREVRWLHVWRLPVLLAFEEGLRIAFSGLTSSVSFSQE